MKWPYTRARLSRNRSDAARRGTERAPAHLPGNEKRGGNHMASTTPQDRTYWNATAEAPAFPSLAGDLSVDIAIVGGGIVGITTARLLKDQGFKVAVIEARLVGRQVTGKSTA